MASPTTADQWIFAQRPNGNITDATFELKRGVPLPELGEGDVLVEAEIFSVDPAMRTWLEEGNKDGSNYVPPVPLSSPMTGGTLVRVLASRAEGIKEGERYRAGLQPGWRTRSVVRKEQLASKLADGVDPRVAMATLGGTGLTAYTGIRCVGRVDFSKAPEVGKGQTAVVSGAAGATGSVAVQLYKYAGFKVVAVAGGPDKCKWVKEVLGADVVIDYKLGREHFKNQLEAVTPGRIQQYFDNTGGWILDEVLQRCAMHSVVIGCGQISQYNNNETDHKFPYNLFPIVTHRIRFEGFIYFDFADTFPDGIALLTRLLKEGKIKAEFTVVKGFENLPRTLIRLYEGANLGKMMVEA
ncbi:putative NADP-dependent oxidoreductase [Hyaloraphidium curvatum]|nr:putative NADP-dependent oxidoreductase [Hyaloraphidium curvatum]